MTTWDQIQQAIGHVRGEPFIADGRNSQGGGCINEAFTLRGEDGSAYFVKLNRPSRRAMFEAEAEALRVMYASGSVRVPQPLVTGVSEDHSFIVMERIEFGGSQRVAAAILGERLAAMHRHTAEQFGFSCDNTIGATPQPNPWQSDWVGFWREQRLGHQLSLAGKNGMSAAVIVKGERLMEAFPALFSTYRPVPSLLHGDLWGGNWAADSSDDPVIFDPASYYGDRETDLAMTELFGGFSADFYAAYSGAWPLDVGYAARKRLYNLYHVLNHFNLFGGGYAMQAEQMIDALLAELR